MITLGGFVLKRTRHVVVSFVSIICLLVLFAFIRSLGTTYIESSHTSYEINGMKNGLNSTKFNKAIDSYTKKHKISAIKVFRVPVVDGGNDTSTRMYVYGEKRKLPAGTKATKNEFMTSDIRYPLYFIGHTNSSSIEKMFKKNGIQYEKVNESWNWGILNFLETNQVFNLILLTFLILGIVLLLANLRELKKINIRSLLGMSNFEDAFRSFLSDQSYFVGVYLIGLMILALYMQVSEFTNTYRIMLYFAFVLYVIAAVVMIFVAIIRARIHSRQTIVNAIKGDMRSQMSFYINMAIKIVIEVFVCVAFVSLLGTLKQDRQLKDQLSIWTKGKTYYTVNLASIQSTAEETKQLNHKAAIFFKYLENHGGMLANYQGWSSDQDNFSDLFSGHVLSVNANYLKVNHVIDPDGKRVILPKDTNTTYVLIPTNQYVGRQQILKSYREYLWLNSAEKKMGVKLHIKAIEIKNGQQLFTYSTAALDLGYYEGTVNSAVVAVLSNESLGGTSQKNVDANSVWLTYLSNEAFLSPSVSTIQKGMKFARITNYIGSIINTKSYAMKQLATVQNNLRLLVTVFGIALSIVVIENIALNSVYFSNNRKKVAIQRLLGMHFFKIFRKFIFLIFVLSLMEASIVLLITKNQTIATTLFVLSNFGEFILLRIQSRRLNKKISSVIKGE